MFYLKNERNRGDGRACSRGCPPPKKEESKGCAGEQKSCEEDESRTKIRPCAGSHCCQYTVSGPELLRWALWSGGFFRCSQGEKSGWHHRSRGGSGLC